ncbi:hypothetical protein M1O52_03560 [Dehalococcoidia bacterium]|nr:hypothetical protein [Dehalococcoidia bacterium]
MDRIALSVLPPAPLEFKASSSIELDERCGLTAAIDGLELDLTAYAVNKPGKSQGPLDSIIGALTMEEWYIKLDPRTGDLDFRGSGRESSLNIEGGGYSLPQKKFNTGEA